MKRLLGFLAVLVAVFSAVVAPSMAQTETAWARFVNVVPGAGPLDIYSDNVLIARNVGFGGATPYIQMTAGEHNINITPPGLDSTLAPTQTITLIEGEYSTLVMDSADLLFRDYRDSLEPLPLGTARLGIIHAINDGPTVDVVFANGNALAAGLQAGQGVGTFDLSLADFVYSVAVVEGGTTLEDGTIVPLAALPLSSGSSYTMIIYGTAARPFTMLLSADVRAEAGSSFFRVAHGVVTPGAVDVYLGDTRVITALDSGQASGYIAVPEDVYSLLITASSDKEVILFEANLDLVADDYLTVLAIAGAGVLDVVIPETSDAVAEIDETTSKFRLMNGLTEGDDAAVTLGDLALIQSLPPRSSAEASITPSTDAFAVSVGDTVLDTVDTVFYGGNYYLYAIVADESGTPVVFAYPSLAIAHTVASVPNPNTIEVVSSEPTPAPIEATAVATNAEVVAAPTTAPVVATPVTSGPTATVTNLEPTANMRLREYPRADANTLHLIGPGTVLIVNGREGAPFFGEGVPVPPNLPEFVDPATLLTDNRQDLAPDQTWLNVTYLTPDGGTITAWANALFLDVRRPNGQRQRLADLPTVPNNLAGTLQNTGITPPPPPQNVVFAIATGVETTANLNIRRTPDANGEVLAQVSGGGSAEVLGFNGARSWAFVRVSPITGGSITGWMNVSFITYTWNNGEITLDQIIARNLVPTIEDTRRGESSAIAGAVLASETTSAPVVSVPTAVVSAPQATLPPAVIVPTSATGGTPSREAIILTVRLNPGANLNLRRTPNIGGEVLAQIPTDTQLVLEVRTADGQWARTTFQGVTGWVSTDPRFSVLSRNNRPAVITDVPLESGQVVAGTPVVGATNAAGTPSGNFDCSAFRTTSPFDRVNAAVDTRFFWNGVVGASYYTVVLINENGDRAISVTTPDAQTTAVIDTLSLISPRGNNFDRFLWFVEAYDQTRNLICTTEAAEFIRSR
jgi:uncharacterized protein YgiM (DUF1202 family)